MLAEEAIEHEWHGKQIASEVGDDMVRQMVAHVVQEAYEDTATHE